MQNQINPLRRTKIIATLGPATQENLSLVSLLDTGVDLVRLNFSHGNHQQHVENIKRIRQWSKTNNREIGIIADIQGSKIRLGEVSNSEIEIHKDELILIDPKFSDPGNNKIIGVNYKDIASELEIKDILLIDDGLIKFEVVDIIQDRITCKILNDGILKSNKGINREGGGLSGISFTSKDQQDLDFALSHRVDFIALSFVRDQNDILKVRQLIKAANINIHIIAKIENKQSLQNLTEIINSADGIMVARGDLGLEIGIENVPFFQKHLISKTRELNKPVITATQILESMTTKTMPTRAEVSDIANAILDCTDAIMFSGETASGEHPDLVVHTANKICLSSEKNPTTAISQHRIEKKFSRIDESIAMASMYIANHQDIQAIVCITTTGTTPLLMSRIRSNIPIYAISPNITIIRIMNLYRNVYPIMFNYTKYQHTSINQRVINELLELNLIKKNIP
ncbi:MAG: pyruvate kinase, partial [Legionellales bacterium]|nr:pyruvate kinase [Legionellales bacterium]